VIIKELAPIFGRETKEHALMKNKLKKKDVSVDMDVMA